MVVDNRNSSHIILLQYVLSFGATVVQLAADPTWVNITIIQAILCDAAADHYLWFCCRITYRHCRQPKLPNFIYSSNITSRQLMRRANNNNLGFPKANFQSLALKASFHFKNLFLSPSTVSLIRTKSSACSNSSHHLWPSR